MALLPRRGDPLRDRYRLQGGYAGGYAGRLGGRPGGGGLGLGSYDRYPGLAADLRTRSPLIRGGGYGRRDPLEACVGGLGRYDDPLLHLGRRPPLVSYTSDDLDHYTRARLPDLTYTTVRDHKGRYVPVVRRHPHDHSHEHAHYQSLPLAPLTRLGCEDCRRIGRRCDVGQDHHCDANCAGRCTSRGFCIRSETKLKKEYKFKTKDITVRGKSYAIRKSYISEAPKFEADLIKFVDKKKETELSDDIVEMLVDFINEEGCQAGTILDFVMLNILATSLGAKSAVEYSLNQIKKFEIDYPMRATELADICCAVMLSNKVDTGLEEWLKKYLKYDRRIDDLARSARYQEIVQDHPELRKKLEVLLGIGEQINDEGRPII
jgi:hypothetical protein